MRNLATQVLKKTLCTSTYKIFIYSKYSRDREICKNILGYVQRVMGFDWTCKILADYIDELEKTDSTEKYECACEMMQALIKDIECNSFLILYFLINSLTDSDKF